MGLEGMGACLCGGVVWWRDVWGLKVWVCLSGVGVGNCVCECVCMGVLVWWYVSLVSVRIESQL